MHKGAIEFSDGIIIGSESVDTSVDYLSVAQDKPILLWNGEETMQNDHLEFFRSLIEAEVSQ